MTGKKTPFRNHLADLNSPITVIDVLLVSKQIPHFGVQGHCRPVRSPTTARLGAEKME